MSRMSFGSRGTKDFGLSGNLTLPKTEAEPFNDGSMPGEKGKVKRSVSFMHRFKGIFRRKSKRESSPYVVSSSTGDDDRTQARLRRSESDPELSATKKNKSLGTILEEKGDEGKSQGDEGKSQGDGGRQSKANRGDRKAKAMSTAFEHISPAPNPADMFEVYIVLKTKISDFRTRSRKIVFQRKKDSSDGLGLHFSGGLPPVMVTHVEPGSPAEQEGVQVGDTILELNGLNCRKKVDISQLMELKLSVQQTQTGRNEGPEGNIDEEAWDKIKARQDELESESYTNVLTKLDSSEPEIEDRAETKVMPKKKKNGKGKKTSSSRYSGAVVGEPLAASSPIKEDIPESKREVKKVKKKRMKRISVDGDKSREANSTQNGESSMGEGRKGKSGKKSTSSSSITAKEGNGEAKVSPDPKKKKRRKKKSLEPAEEFVLKEELSPSDDKEGTCEMEDSTEDPSAQKEIKNKEEDISLQQEVPGVDDPAGMARNDRSRRSSSPKSRYHSPPEKGETKVITIGVTRKKRKGDDGPSQNDSRGGEKKRKSRAANKEKKELKEASKKVESQDSTLEPVSEERVMLDTPPSAAVSGSIESNTLSFVSPKKDTKSSLKRQRGKKKEDPETKRSTLPRQTKNVIPTTTTPNKSSVTRSTSLSHLEEEEKKNFHEELRQASKSQQDMANAGDDLNPIIEIDPNIKVKKSGVIKEDKSSARPSIFNQSSSPEPEEVSVSSGAVEDNILDPDFRVKKSGVVVGRKTSTTIRPSILDEHDTKTATDIQPGEMKYNMKLIEEMGISVKPAKEEKKMESQGVMAESSHERNGVMAESSHEKSTSYTFAARKMFKEKQDANGGKFNGRFNKFVEMPVKIRQHQDTPKKNMAAEVADKKPAASSPFRVRTRVGTEGVDSAGNPSWITIAQGLQKRATVIEKKEPVIKKASPTSTATTPTPTTRATTPTPTPRATTPTTPTPRATTPTTATRPTTKDKTVPEMGHVAKRLAMFQNH